MPHLGRTCPQQPPAPLSRRCTGSRWWPSGSCRCSLPLWSQEWKQCGLRAWTQAHIPSSGYRNFSQPGAFTRGMAEVSAAECGQRLQERLHMGVRQVSRGICLGEVWGRQRPQYGSFLPADAVRAAVGAGAARASISSKMNHPAQPAV